MTAHRRNGRRLAALLVAEVVSTTGTEISAIALPWFVLVTTGSPARMGAVMAAEFAGMTVLGIPSGRAATALGPRRSMLAADLVRGSLVAMIPALHWAGALSFPVILAVGFAVGAFFPAYASSQRLVLAGLVGEDEVALTRLGGLLGSVNETASFVGPAIGGILVALFGPAGVLLIDSGSYLLAFALIATFIPPAPVPERERRAGAVEALRRIRRDRPLLRLVVGIAIMELSWTAMVATLPVVALRRFDAGAQLAGWLLASYGAGSLIGGLISSRARSAGDRTQALAIAGLAVTTWPLLAPLPAWGVALAVAANGGCAGVFFPRFFAAVTLRTPPALRARVMTTVMTAISATGPLGFLAAGLLLQRSTSASAGFGLVAATATLGAAVAGTGRRADRRPRR